MIIVSKEYESNTNNKTSHLITTEEYLKKLNYNTVADYISESIKKILSPEVDIFSELPTKVYNIEYVKLFLDDLRACILNHDPEDFRCITLPKLRVTELTDITIVIEWIFNYYRLYFTFDKNEGCFYGVVKNDIENNEFLNEFKKMDQENFSIVAETELEYAILMAKGGK